MFAPCDGRTEWIAYLWFKAIGRAMSAPGAERHVERAIPGVLAGEAGERGW